jgi:hypothetical protein
MGIIDMPLPITDIGMPLPMAGIGIPFPLADIFIMGIISEAVTPDTKSAKAARNFIVL